MDENQISLAEFIKQLTSRVYKSHPRLPFKDEKPWHMLFYRLKKEDFPGKPSFFEDLQFDWVGRYPICQDLSDYIHVLHFTGCMSAGNPSYDEISLNPRLAQRWSAEFDKLSGALPKFIDKAAQLAQEEFTK